MATLPQAVATGVLEMVPVPDWDGRTAVRRLYASPDFLDLIESDGPLHDPEYSIGLKTLYEHLWQFMADFRCLARPPCGDVHRVMPSAAGVWKIHPPGLRVFGWAPARHCLALVEHALADDTHKTKGLVAQKRQKTLAFIKANQLTQTVLKGDYLAIFPHQQD